MRRATCVAVAVLMAVATVLAIEPRAGPAAVAGGTFSYVVRPNDSLTSVGARFGVDAGTLARANGLDPQAWLKVGQRLEVDNRHIVPERLQDGILINIPQRMLYLFRAGELLKHYPVGLGRPDWRTPPGSYSVLSREHQKTWYVPRSIQEEMRREGKPVLESVPPGPDNPLGEYWIRISPERGIHGTIHPASIYGFHTHGCIRLHPDDIAELYWLVEPGLPVKIIYRPVLLAAPDEGGIRVEAHRDIYRLADDPLEAAWRAAAAAGVDEWINPEELAEVVRAREGIAREVTVSVSSLR